MFLHVLVTLGLDEREDARLADVDPGWLELHLPIEIVGAFNRCGDGDRCPALFVFFQQVGEIDPQVKARSLADQKPLVPQPVFAILDATGGAARHRVF